MQRCCSVDILFAATVASSPMISATLPADWIERVIRIDTTTHRSNQELVQFLTPLLQESGLTVQEQRYQENQQTFINLLARSHPSNSVADDNLLALNTHLDTVSGGDPRLWTKTSGNPYQATRVRDRIYGLGAADVKLDFLCKIWAARVARPWKRPFVLAGTYGEERGLVGAQKLFKENPLRPKYALVGEPSNLELIYAHKGHVIFSFRVTLQSGTGVQKHWKGKSAHSSTPDLGENAITKALGEIYKRHYGILSMTAGTDTNRIPELCDVTVCGVQNEGTKRVLHLMQELEELSKTFRKRKDPRFSPPHSTLSLNLARMQGRDLVLTFDIRTLPDLDVERLLATLDRIAAKTRCQFLLESVDRPLRGQKNGRLISAASKCLKNLGVKAVKKTKASSTEAAIYHAYGAEALVFGPGLSIGNAHRPNEYNSVKQLGVATRFYSQMLRTVDF